MAEQSTFVKIDRNILKWRWYQDANTMRVFMHLILMANIEDHDFQKITVHRGELATSLPSLSAQLKISIRSVRTALEHLKTTGEVTATKYPHFQVITILSYDRYQAKPTGKAAGSRQADDRQMTGKRHQSKNGKKGRTEERKDICGHADTTTKIPMPPTIADVIDYCRENGIQTDAEAFVQFNTVRGWKYGKAKIEDWRPLLHQWAAKDGTFTTSENDDPPPELDVFGRPIKPRFE